MKVNLRLADMLFWVLIALLFLWIILKGLGIIGSPKLVELTPYGLLGLLLLVFRYEISGLEHRLKNKIETRTNRIEEKLDEKINQMERRVEKEVTKLEVMSDIVKDIISKEVRGD